MGISIESMIGGLDDLGHDRGHIGGFREDTAIGFSLSDLNPFKVIKKAVSGVAHIYGGAIKDVSDLYKKVTPDDLKKVLRWTPVGLVIRGGQKIAPETQKILGTAVKWSPQGMIYRGVTHAL